jgi:hypothetical protein
MNEKQMKILKFLINHMRMSCGSCLSTATEDQIHFRHVRLPDTRGWPGSRVRFQRRPLGGFRKLALVTGSIPGGGSRQGRPELSADSLYNV